LIGIFHAFHNYRESPTSRPTNVHNQQMTKFLKSLAATALLAVTATSADAVPILSLFNTGVGPTGAPLAEDAVDPHYTLSGGAAAYTATNAQGYPVAPAGPWVGDDSLSAWITPTLDTQGASNAVYSYTTTFDLTGLDPVSAIISGLWAADDAGGLSNIILNGVSSGLSNTNGYSSWTAFSLTSGFQPGLNTLTFQVQNSGGGPTGVRVEMTGTASAAANAVPDGGATAGLLGLGLMGAATLHRRASKRHAR
jgi:hypothetical protein